MSIAPLRPLQVHDPAMDTAHIGADTMASFSGGLLCRPTAALTLAPTPMVAPTLGANSGANLGANAGANLCPDLGADNSTLRMIS